MYKLAAVLLFAVSITAFAGLAFPGDADARRPGFRQPPRYAAGPPIARRRSGGGSTALAALMWGVIIVGAIASIASGDRDDD